MADLFGVVIAGTIPVPQNGITVSLWTPSTVNGGTLPAQNFAQPGSGAIATQVSATTHGSDGGFLFTGLATGTYFVSFVFGGVTYWGEMQAVPALAGMDHWTINANGGLSIGSGTDLVPGASSGLYVNGPGTISGQIVTYSTMYPAYAQPVNSIALGAIIGVGGTPKAYQSFTLYNNGIMQWGTGDAAVDTNFYRSSVGLLRTDFGFSIGTTLAVAGASTLSTTTAASLTVSGATSLAAVTATGVLTLSNAAGQITFGSDTSLYRQGATLLYTNASMNMVGALNPAYTASINTIGLQMAVSGDSAYRYVVDNTGKIQWGPGGSAAPDTALYRSTVNGLQTNGSFVAAGTVYPGYLSSTVGAFAIANYVTGDTQPRLAITAGGTVNWGPGGSTAADTNLYRLSAGALKTDGSLTVGGNIIGPHVDKGGRIFLASAYGGTKNSAAINAALTAATSVNGTVVVNGTGWVFDANITIPPRCVLSLEGCSATVTASAGSIDVITLSNASTLAMDSGTFILLGSTSNVARVITNLAHTGTGQEWCAIMCQPGAFIQAASGAVVSVAVVDWVQCNVNSTIAYLSVDGLGYLPNPLMRISSGTTAFGPIYLETVLLTNTAGGTSAGTCLQINGPLNSAYSSMLYSTNLCVQNYGTYGIDINGGANNELHMLSFINTHIERHLTNSTVNAGVHVNGGRVFINGLDYSQTSPGETGGINTHASTTYGIWIRNVSSNAGTTIIQAEDATTTLPVFLKDDLTGGATIADSFIPIYTTNSGTIRFNTALQVSAVANLYGQVVVYAPTISGYGQGVGATAFSTYQGYGDSYPSVAILADGPIKWSSRTAVADTALYRSGVGQLRTDTEFSALKVRTGSTTGPVWSSGTGSPNSAVTGNVGDLYTRTDGGTTTTLYVKESGAATNTGWVAK